MPKIALAHTLLSVLFTFAAFPPSIWPGAARFLKKRLLLFPRKSLLRVPI